MRSRGQGWSAYLHVHQRAVLSSPAFLQNLKDGHGAAIHDVHLTLADSEAGQTELSVQQLLFRPLWVIVGIVLQAKVLRSIRCEHKLFLSAHLESGH